MIVTLTTDFGTADGYVGALKGVIYTHCPTAQVVDISHDIPPQDVVCAALMLPTFVHFFPTGTVHVVVVDPGVGSERQGIALALDGQLLVGPDNGLFGPLWATARARHAVALTEPRFWRATVSSTFHGRDIFAPVAAQLAAGLELALLGPPLAAPLALTLPVPSVQDATLTGAVVAIDRFGNCITNIAASDLAALGALDELTIEVDGQVVGGLRRTYSEGEVGQPIALLGSGGQLEIAVREGDAASALGLVRGALVRVRKPAGGEVVF